MPPRQAADGPDPVPWSIAAAAAVARYHDCRFWEQAWKGDHGPAMRMLAKPPPKRTDFVIAWAVRQFLDEIRDNHPSVERDFEADTIAWGDAELERRRQRSPWGLVRRFLN